MNHSAPLIASARDRSRRLISLTRESTVARSDVRLDARDVRRLCRVGVRREPGIEHLARKVGAREPQPHHEHVRVVVLARARRGDVVGTERGAHASHLVRRDRRARAGPAEEHAGVACAAGDELAYLAPDLGPLLVLAPGRTDATDVVTARLELSGDDVSELRALVGPERNLHAPDATARLAEPPLG